MQKFYILILIVLTSFTLFASNRGISLDQLEADVRYFASDELKGRGNFSPEIHQAANYIIQRYESIGLKPYSAENNYKQGFQLYQIKPKSVEININGKDIATENVLGFSMSESVIWDSNSEIVITELGLGDDLRAAINNANASGGHHLIFAHPHYSQMFERYRSFFSSGRAKLNLTQGGSLVIILAEGVPIETMALNLEMEILETTVNNLIGIIPGSSNADELVIISAHYDHLGVINDEIYNGADDNASGVSAVLGLAQHYADKEQPKRTLMFVAFAAEENGILGSRYFANAISPEDVIAMINFEMLGTVSGYGKGKVWMTGSDRSNLLTLMNLHLDNEEHIKQDPYARFNLFYRSDNASLARLGVPAHSFSSTQIDKAYYYHQPSDEVDVINFESLYLSTKLLAKATEPLAQGMITPSRVETAPAPDEGKIF